jgi:hypothetical protein
VWFSDKEKQNSRMLHTATRLIYLVYISNASMKFKKKIFLIFIASNQDASLVDNFNNRFEILKKDSFIETG